jgi:uracil-DNA glycosylase
MPSNQPLPDFPESWRGVLDLERSQPWFQSLESALASRQTAGEVILPERDHLFAALALTPPDQVRAVILGQDPYPTPGHAHGLCFSVQRHVRPIPRSLVTVFRELNADLGIFPPGHGCLEAWARSGVLLLNTVLSVPSGNAGGHARLGWETFTDRIIEILNQRRDRMVFLLWGKTAWSKEPLVRVPRHAVLKAFHPSPLARGRFLGCRCFSATNQLLTEAGRPPIDWSLPP